MVKRPGTKLGSRSWREPRLQEEGLMHHVSLHMPDSHIASWVVRPHPLLRAHHVNPTLSLALADGVLAWGVAACHHAAAVIVLSQNSFFEMQSGYAASTF